MSRAGFADVVDGDLVSDVRLEYLLRDHKKVTRNRMNIFGKREGKGRKSKPSEPHTPAA